MPFQAPVDDLTDLHIATLVASRSWQAKYKLLMAWGNCIQVKPWMRCDERRVRGCDTALWLAHCAEGDRHWFAVDGESRIIKGLAALLMIQVNGRTTEAIAALDVAGLLAESGLDGHLSPSRANGFGALVKRIQASVGSGGALAK